MEEYIEIPTSNYIRYGNIYSYSLLGIDAYPIQIESDIRSGIPKFAIVGLPSSSVKESKDRVTAAIRNSGFEFKPFVYTINLAPADLPKDGVATDLPIALSILKASKQLQYPHNLKYAFIGELALNGKLRPVRGILPMVMQAKKNKLDAIILPKGNQQEASIVEGINIIGVSTLQECVRFLQDEISIQPTPFNFDQTTLTPQQSLDMYDVKGQLQVKRALEIAAAGGHNILMIGPPGSGKTMLAKRLTSVLPDMSLEEILQTTKIYSIAGKLIDQKENIVATRPFRSPHHTISDIALIGGGSYPKPGEVSLAHNGVLFLDELPEFKKNVLEVLRQPLEDGTVCIARANSTLSFPADFMLVASMNPCPCGYYGSNLAGHECTCSPAAIQRYRSRISGPLLDRFDIHIEVGALKYEELEALPCGEPSQKIRDRVNEVRSQQRKKLTGIFSNSQMLPEHIRKYCQINKKSSKILKIAIEQMGLSARAYDKILKISRTIADMENCENIQSQHISEAIQYRSLDRKFWE